MYSNNMDVGGVLYNPIPLYGDLNGARWHGNCNRGGSKVACSCTITLMLDFSYELID